MDRQGHHIYIYMTGRERLSGKLTQRAHASLCVQLALCTSRNVAWDPARKLYVVTWKARANEDDEPWAVAGLRSKFLGRRTCLVVVVEGGKW